MANREHVPHLACYINLLDYAGTDKQLALLFGFDVQNSSSPGRILIYNDACLLQDQTLVYGDNQFLIAIEYLDMTFSLYFTHAGGGWFFRGLSGYVV